MGIKTNNKSDLKKDASSERRKILEWSLNGRNNNEEGINKWVLNGKLLTPESIMMLDFWNLKYIGLKYQETICKEDRWD